MQILFAFFNSSKYNEYVSEIVFVDTYGHLLGGKPMKYGYFDDKNREYVITVPGTPLPWINYLGRNDMYGLISNTAGGYTFYKDAKLRRLTRFRYNNVPRDFGGRYYYIKDGNTIWNPSYMPCQTELDSYTCRHGLGYSIFESSKNEISSSLLCFIPLNDNVEIHKLVLKNNSSKLKTINIYGTTEWCLYNAVDDSSNFQRNYNIGEVEIDKNTIYHITEYRERRNHFSFFNVNRDIDGFDSDLDTFVGKMNSWTNPEAVLKGTSFSSKASGWSPIAAFRNDVKLQPGEEITLIYLLGYSENDKEDKYLADGSINKKKAVALIEKYSTLESVNQALADLAQQWEKDLSTFQISSPNKKFDRMINIWNQYQCMTTYNLSRSASYFESGMGRGMGFRDSCQDILGFVHIIPEKARERIIDIASIQFEDGSTYHQYQPLNKKGNADVGSGFNDDPLWLVACTSAYIKETGDLSILNEQVPFNNILGSEVPLFEHLTRSVNYISENRGPHGLPLIGRADWNDCLNLNCFSLSPGESFQTASNYDSHKAESVFIAGMFVLYGKEYCELAKLMNKEKEVREISRAINEIEKSVIKNGWDGKWYLRAYDAFENKVGSKENEEGKIFIEPQGMCAMAGIGESFEMPKQAIESLEKYLLCDYGVQLLTPCYSKYHIELGEITTYPPGYKENGSVFCHTNPWIVIAETLVGNNEKAFEIYKKYTPSFIENISNIHRSEPYVYCQTIAGKEAQNYGEGKNSWLTGTASWSFVAASQSILGIQPTYDGLIINPHLPKEFDKVKVVRTFRGVVYTINILNKYSGIYKMIVDGVESKDKFIKYDNKKTTVDVEIRL
jgi:cellobiose phosphorylase